MTVLVALLVCLIPTTIGGLLSAIGIAGMDRLIRFNVVATSGRAVEAAGDVDTLLLDKTGTITFGNRMPSEFVAGRRRARARRWPKPCCWRASPTRRRRAAPSWRWPSAATAWRSRSFDGRERHGRALHGPDPHLGRRPRRGRSLRKGAVDSVLAAGRIAQRRRRAEFRQAVDRIARTGGTPLAVAENNRLLGVVHLKDTVKPDIKERFAELRAMGIRTVMVTGDNPVTAAAIASEAGVDDFLARGEARGQARLYPQGAGRAAG